MGTSIMRIAVVSDIHANRTAFEAVIADLAYTSPDVVFHGGDLADGGSSPIEIIDHIRDRCWPGVIGNTDEMLSKPETFEAFASKTPRLERLWTVIRDMAAATREVLGEERLEWLRTLPRMQTHNSMALMHASPATPWHAPMPNATDTELLSIYGVINQPLVVYGHIHVPYVRALSGKMVANSGSIGLPHDGDRRASYLLIDDGIPHVRRVDYPLDREVNALRLCGLPHSEWVIRILESGLPQMP